MRAGIGLEVSPPVVARRRPWTIGALAGAVVVVAAGVALWMWQSSGTRWARDVALPEILRLADLDRNGEAFLLATQAEARIGGDPVLNGVWPRISREVSITTTPAGADVSLRLIGGDTTWHPVGRTPLVNTRLPRGVFWWRFEKAGYEPIEIVRATGTVILPGFAGGGAAYPAVILRTWSLFRFRRQVCDSRWRASTTTRPFPHPTTTSTDTRSRTRSSRRLSTRAAMRNGALDRALRTRASDARLGRGNGPLPRQHRTPWTGDLAGRHLPGRPGGLAGNRSELVAAAAAAFRGKRLPTIYHWSYAAKPELGNAITRSSHFGGGGHVRVGTAPGLGAYGTVDMAGNVKEWVWNEQTAPANATSLAARGTILTTSFSTRMPGRLFDRSDTNGFRCVVYGAGPAPAASLAAPIVVPADDFATRQPVADAVYRIYADQYSYDRPPFDVRVESTDDASPLWRR